MDKTIPDWKKIIREQLEMLASEEEQLSYERNVPHVDITKELLCGWFNDSYHPTDSGFCSCFNEKELEALAAINHLYNKQSGLLPPSNGTVRNWLNNPVWREVMREAEKTLKHIRA
jgi:hypothetical protein